MGPGLPPAIGDIAQLFCQSPAVLAASRWAEARGIQIALGNCGDWTKRLLSGRGGPMRWFENGGGQWGLDSGDSR